MNTRTTLAEGNGSGLLTAEYLPVDELHLDPKNPRICEIDEDLSEEELLEVLWREFSVEEVALSIAENGFFPHEPLFVAEEEGNLVVVEGNRRLAAVLILRDSDLQSKLQITSIPDITTDELEKLARLPVIRCQRDQIWQYIGFKHVNGPQVWTSFAKAEYIAWVRNDLGTDLKDIARTIGDTHSTVARFYRAYMALDQAETSGVYNRDRRTRRHFSFSHLYTGLDYPGIRKFTGVANLDPPTPKPIPTNKLKNFGELCVWLWGDSREKQNALIRSQNPHLRELDEALQSKRGLESLRAGYGLSRSVDVSRGETALFRKALLDTKESLKDAHSVVSLGFHGEPDLQREIDEILVLIDDLKERTDKITAERRKQSRQNRKK